MKMSPVSHSCPNLAEVPISVTLLELRFRVSRCREELVTSYSIRLTDGR